MITMRTTIYRHIEEAIHQSAPGRVMPLVLICSPGTGVYAAIGEVCADMDVDMVDVRCPNLSSDDFRALPLLKDGQVLFAEPSLSWLQRKLETERTTVILMDEAVANGHEVAAGILAQANRDAKGPVIALMVIGPDEMDDANKALMEGLGLLGTMVTFRHVTSDENMLQDFLAHARANGVDRSVIAFIEEEGLSGATMAAWVRFAAIVGKDEIDEPRMVAVMGEAILGTTAIAAFTAWYQRRAGRKSDQEA